jgi:excisionase family DNA binding protein
MNLTPAQLAAEYQVSTGTILRRLRAGEIPGFMVGRFWRIDPDDLAAWKAGPARPADPSRIEPRSARSTAALGRKRAS